MSAPSDRLHLLEDSRLTLERYLDAIRRRWWLVVLIPLVALGAAAVPVLGSEEEFRSSITVRIHSGDPAPPVTAESDFSTATVAAVDLQVIEVHTELSVLRSSGLRADVVEALGPDGAEFGAVDAAPDGLSSAIVVSVIAGSPDAATAAARAYGEVYIDQRADQVIEPLLERATDLRTEAASATAELVEIDERLADPATAPFLADSLLGQRASLDRRVSDLAQRADTLEVEAERRSSQTTVISPASKGVSITANPLRGLLKWFAVGLAAGLAAAVLLREIVDER